MRHVPKLLLLLALGVAAPFLSCEQHSQRFEGDRTPRTVEASPDLFVRDEGPDLVTSKERLLEVADVAPPPSPTGAVKAKVQKVAKVDPRKPTSDAQVVARSEELPPSTPPTGEPAPGTTGEGRPFVPPTLAPRIPPEVPATPPPDRSLTTATNVSLAIGAVGFAMGAAAAAGDGTPAETTMAVSWMGVGAAGFATAGVLYLIDPNPEKGVKVMAGPGMVGLRGTF